MVVTVLLIASAVAMSAVAAGAATASASNSNESANDELELSVDGTDSIATDESAAFNATVTNSGDEEVTIDVVFEIDGEPVREEVTVGPDDTESVTFTAEGYVFDEGEYDWTITADGEEDSGVLTVTDDADEESADENTDENGADEEGDEEAADDENASEEDAGEENASEENDGEENASEEENADEEGDEEAGEEGANDEASDDPAADDEGGDEGDDGMPGFGVGVALSALLAVALLTLRRQG
ncbi:PGF-CTERM sorting domain-containing protein [Natronococcus wangiae]|uniref:PGF-CTERM sorting domain-containing protein n=1 Tax=Natronococcus wangiae TaxID=3068275 RepID=UPI00273EC13D|nr:PGF-CTERM sorting domain-containing protein [Natronococcus sp. AD5]